MTRADQRDAPSASELRLLSQAVEALDEVHSRLGPRFRRAESRRRVRRFLEGWLAPVERKNGWQLAEAVGERGPHGVQRLLYEADWDHEAVREELRAYVLAHLGEEAGVLVVEETGFREVWPEVGGRGTAIQRHGWGPRELPDRRLSRVGQPQGGGFHRSAAVSARRVDRGSGALPRGGHSRRGELCHQGGVGQSELARAFAAGVRAQGGVGDTIDGTDLLRTWLESQHQPYGLAVAETHPVWSEGRAQLVGLVAALAACGGVDTALGGRREPGATVV